MGVKFDPMTGKPIQEGGQNVQFDPMTGQPIGAAVLAKKKTKFKFFGVLGAAAVVAVVGVVGIKSGLFMGKANKVLMAAQNTFEQTGFLEKLDVSKLLDSKKYTIDISGSVEDMDFNMSLASKKKSKSISGEVSYSGMTLDLLGGIKDKTIAVSMPCMDEDTVFIYDYSKENEGYLIETLEEETGMKQEVINQTIDALVSGETGNELAEDVEKATLKWFRNLKFEKVGKEKFEVNGKNVSCKGYGTVITSDDAEEYVAAMETILEEYIKETQALFDMAEMDTDDITDAVGDLFDEGIDVEDMEDVAINFYIYKNKLACVQMEYDGKKAELQFRGGDTRTQNMCLEVEGQEVFELEGSSEGQEENYELSVAGVQAGEMTYNTKSGEYSIEIGNTLLGYGMNIEGVITAKRKEKTFTIEEIEAMGQKLPLEISVIVKSGAEIKMPKGEKFDIGNASESELEDMVEDLTEEYQQAFSVL